MTLVVDANIIGALILPLPYSAEARRSFDRWATAGSNIIAPTLLLYEVDTILRRAISAELLDPRQVVACLQLIAALGISTVEPTESLRQRALGWAERLGDSKAYDAHYLATAEADGLDLYTADQRLVARASKAGAAWVRWVGDLR